MIWVLGRTRIQGTRVSSSRLSPRAIRALSLSSPLPSPSPSPSSRPPSSLSPIYATHPPSTFSDQDVDTFRGRQGNLWHNNILDEQARLRRIDQLRIKLAPPGAARSRVLVSRGRIIAESEAKRDGEEGAVWVEEDEKMVVWVDLPPKEGSGMDGEGEEMGPKNRHSILTSSFSCSPDQPQPSSWTPNPSLQSRPLPPHDPTNPRSILYNPRSTHSPFLPSTLSSSPSYPPLLLLPNHLYKHLPSAPSPFPSLDLKFFRTLLDPNAPPTYEPTPLGKLDLSVPPVGRGAQPVLRTGRPRVGRGRGEEAVHPKRVELGREGWEVVERLGRRFLVEGEGEGMVGRTGEEEEGRGERKDLGEWVEEVRRLQRVEREGTARGVVDASRGSNFSSVRPLPPPPPPTSPSPSSPANRLSAHTQEIRPATSTSSPSKPERVPPTFTHFVVDPFGEELSTPISSPPPSRYQPKAALSQARSTPRKSEPSPKPNPSLKLEPSPKPFAFLGSTTLVPPSSTISTTSIKPTPTHIPPSPTASKQLPPPTQSKTTRRKLDDASPSLPTPASSSSTPAVTPNSPSSTAPLTLASVSLHPHSQPQAKPQPKPTRRTLNASSSSPIKRTPTPTPKSTLESEETASLYLSFLFFPPSSTSSDDASTRLKEIVRSKLRLPSLPSPSSPTSKPNSNPNPRGSTSHPLPNRLRISLREWWEEERKD